MLKNLLKLNPSYLFKIVKEEGAEVFLNEEGVIRYCKVNLAHFKAPKKVVLAGQLQKMGSAKIC